MPWEPLPVETDPDAVTDRILDEISAKLPGWIPVEGAPEVVLAEEIGRETALTNTRVVDATNVAVSGIGETVFGLAALLGSQATITVQLTVTGAGAEIPAGFTVVGTTADGIEVAFELLQAVTADGPTVAILMHARDITATSNGVPPGPLVVVTATATVTAAEALTESAGGVDPEQLEAYLSRLVDYVAVLRPGGVRASDLAVLARNVTGVHRALGIDLYDPNTGTSDNERTATVVPIDVDGQPVSAAAAAEVEAMLEDVREVNFVIHVAEPSYTPVDIDFAAVAETGADPVQVQANIHAAIAAHIDPATWGSSLDDPAAWVETSTLRYLDLARVAGSAEGVAYLQALTVNGGTGDVALPGPASLPAPLAGDSPSTVTGTVT